MPITANVAGVAKPPYRLYGNVGGVEKRINRGFVKVAGVWRVQWQEEVVVTLASSGNIVITSLFSAADWANPILNKRVVIPVGVALSAANASYAIAIGYTADGQAGSFAGELTIENRGTISGLGGLANSGVGGNAVWANFLGRAGNKATLINYGTIRGAGGGGGRGGAGGTGLVYDYQDTGMIYGDYVYMWVGHNTNVGYVQIYWGGGVIYDGLPGVITSIDLSGWRYEKGPLYRYNGVYIHNYIRRYLVTPNNIFTGGAAGGAGGRGQGSDGANQGGAGGGNNGGNSGIGGTGGTGGGFGAQGNTGNTGASGNYTAGVAGSVGGLAGGYISESTKINFTNLGTVQGRLL